MKSIARSLLVGSIGLAALGATGVASGHQGAVQGAAPGAAAQAGPGVAAQCPGMQGVVAAEYQPGAALAAYMSQVLGAENQLAEQQVAAMRQIGAQIERAGALLQQASMQLMAGIADQLAAGRIQAAALQGAIGDLAAVSCVVGPQMQAGFQAMHGVLTPEQRAAYADAMQGRGRPGAGQRGIAPEQPQGAAGRRGAGVEKGGAAADQTGFDRWAAELGLNDAQKRQVLAAIQQMHATPARGDKALRDLMGSFRGEQFSAGEALATEQIQAAARDTAMRLLRLADQLTQILTPEQRAQLASEIKHSTSGGPIGGQPTPGASKPTGGHPSGGTAEPPIGGSRGPAGAREPIGTKQIGNQQAPLIVSSTYPGVYSGYGLYGSPYFSGYSLYDRPYAYTFPTAAYYDGFGAYSPYRTNYLYSTSIPYFSGWGTIW